MPQVVTDLAPDQLPNNLRGATRFAAEPGLGPGVARAAGAATPLFVKEAIDRGVIHGDRTALYVWCGAILGVGLVEAAGGAFRHYFAIRNRARGDAYVRDEIYGRALEL